MYGVNFPQSTLMQHLGYIQYVALIFSWRMHFITLQSILFTQQCFKKNYFRSKNGNHPGTCQQGAIVCFMWKQLNQTLHWLRIKNKYKMFGKELCWCADCASCRNVPHLGKTNHDVLWKPRDTSGRGWCRYTECLSWYSFIPCFMCLHR